MTLQVSVCVLLQGGILTAADLAGYTAEWREALTFPIGHGMTVAVPPSPSGGPVVQFILNILKSKTLLRYLTINSG